MCTTISHTAQVNGAARGGPGWFPVAQATVAYDHPGHVGEEHAVLIDFAKPAMGPGARIGVELDLASGRVLLDRLRDALEAAERFESVDQPEALRTNV